MAPRTFVRVDVTGFLDKMEKSKKTAAVAIKDLQMEAAQAGAEKMKEYIETRGTGNKSWGYFNRKKVFIPKPLPAKVNKRSGSLRSGSHPGRVNTGEMRDSVGVRFERGGVKTIAAFGWIRNFKQYFEYQEYGFEAGGFRPPQEVRGMFALRDARLFIVQNVLPRLMRKYENRIARGKY